MRVKIKEAIDHYNENRKVKEPRMTMKRLGEQIGVDPWYISRWNTGNNLGQFSPEILKAICELLSTDANQIYGIHTDKSTPSRV